MARESDIEWDAIRHFLCAAQAKSFSGAARALGVEHTTVGRRVSGLERSIGAALVERGPTGLGLTPLGQRAFDIANDIAALVRAIAELAAAERTSVRLVVPTGFTAVLTPHLEALQREHPQLSLDIVSSGRRVDLRKREADLAIRVGPIDDDALVARKLGEIGIALYAARLYLERRGAVDVNDLAGHSIVGFHRSLAHLPGAQWLEARSARATIVLRSREAMDMLAAAQNGAGLAVLPCFLGDADPALVRLTSNPIAMRRFSLVYRRDSRLSPEVRSVITFIIAVMTRHAPELRGRPATPARPTSSTTRIKTSPPTSSSATIKSSPNEKPNTMARSP